MRKRELQKVINKSNDISGDSFGEPLYFRPYQGDDKTIAEIARSTGEKKSAVAQKLIRIALSGGEVKIGENRTEEKLDWLIQKEKHRAAENGSSDLRIIRLEEHGREIEESFELLTKNSQQIQTLLSELFCMTNVTISYLNQIFTKLLEYLSPIEIERTRSSDFASRNILGLIEHSLSELDKCRAHHNLIADNDTPDFLYLQTKIEKIRERIAAENPSDSELTMKDDRE